jgi:trans-aconitate methyltransferase
MFTTSVPYYAAFYGAFKDYAAEAEAIAALIHEHHPSAETVLDVGCGPGDHAHLLATEHGYAVDGIDVASEFVQQARETHPDGAFWVADMVDFNLGRRYHVVLCLFSAIGYVQTLENVRRTLQRFRRHLHPGGLVIVEPWFTPEVWEPGSIYCKTVETDEWTLCRMSHAAQNGRRSILQFEYLLGRPDGIQRFSERHELGLFTVAEMTSCFEDAGFTVTHREDGLTDRGLYLAHPT